MKRRNVELAALIAIATLLTMEFSYIASLGPFLHGKILAWQNTEESSLAPSGFDRVDDSEYLDIRKAALYQLGSAESASDAAVGALTEIALDPFESELARTAVYVLGDLKSDKSVIALISILEQSKLVAVRKAAAHTLADSADSDKDPREILAQLVQTVETDASTEVRKAALYALKDLETKDSNRALIKIVRQIQN